MDIKDIFLIISTIFSLITPLVGLISIFKGEYKPQRTTRLVLLIVTSIFLATLIVQQNPSGIILAFVQFILCLIFFLLSFPFGVGGNSKTDVIVFISAMITLFIWKTTNSAELALYLSILTDIIGFSPTIIKSYKQPFTEDPKFYGSDIFTGFFNVISTRKFTFANIAFPFYIFLINLIITLVIVFRRRYKG